MVGTCRVHNPFLSLALLGSARKLRRDFNTFTHSGDEALQHIRYTRGELDIPDALAPYIFGTPESPERTTAGMEVARDLDMLVVEICTLSRIRYRDYSFQPNFFARYFVGKGQQSLLPWWRRASRNLPGAREQAEELIRQRRDEGDPFSELDEDILRNLSCAQLDQDGCRAEMRRVAEEMDLPVVFVPHFTIARTNRPRLQEREQLRRYVVAAAAEIGQSCLDATPLLVEFGEKFARKNDGKDLHHYSEVFEDHLGKIYLDLIRERLGQDMAAS